MQPFSYDKIILFGDSITQRCFDTDRGFSLGGSLQNHFVRRLDVLNRGYGGYNTAWAKCIFPRILQTEITEYSKIRLMTIFLGTNDARNTIQRIQIEEFESNLLEMVNTARKYNINLILIGPALYDPVSAQEIGISTNKQILEYSKVVEKIAKKENLPFIDLWNAFRKYNNYTEEEILSDTCNLENLLSDGVHFNGNGYKILYDELMKKIEENFPDLSLENFPRRLQEYKLIDRDNIEASVFENEK